MSDDQENPLLITPPPGLSIPTRATKADAAEPHSGQADTAPESFITLPPGVIDSGTFRVSHPRVVPTSPKKSREDIVFFPAQPGIPAAAPMTAAPMTAAPMTAAVDDDPEATRLVSHTVPHWHLVLPEDAGTLTLERALLLGRNPARTPERPDVELISLVDTAKTLSKTHALLEAVDGRVWVHDLDSTNGVFIVPAQGEAVEVLPGTRVQVPAGADLELGEYVIRVEFT